MKIITKPSKERVRAIQIMAEIAKLRDELQKIKFVRKLENGHSKKIFAEYVEHTIAVIFNLNLTKITNTKGYDAQTKDKLKKKIQIKEITRSAARFTESNKGFNYLITVRLNNEDFSLTEICLYPKEFVFKKKNGTYKHIGYNQTFRVKKTPEFENCVVFRRGVWKKKDIKF